MRSGDETMTQPYNATSPSSGYAQNSIMPANTPGLAGKALFQM